MEHYINKDILIAKIKRRMDKNREKQSLPQYFGMIEEDLNILSFIDTLEVKEIDIENIAITEWNDYIKKIDGDYAYMLIKREDYIVLAKHFFELGLKAQKGE